MVSRVHTALSPAPLSVDAALRFVADAGAGGTVLFTGTVRDHADARAVRGLEYEAFEERAGAQLAGLAGELAEKWPTVRAAWIEHRVGQLPVGEPAVVVAVAAPHRAEAFEAARWAIDTLKASVAIWKRELWADGGAHWPGSPDGGEA
jgi:molybdopterin synthase catalytic subunit